MVEEMQGRKIAVEKWVTPQLRMRKNRLMMYASAFRPEHLLTKVKVMVKMIVVIKDSERGLWSSMRDITVKALDPEIAAPRVFSDFGHASPQIFQRHISCFIRTLLLFGKHTSSSIQSYPFDCA